MKQYPEQANFAKRDAEKKALRERDVAAISNGKPAKSLRERNFMFSGIDMSRVVAIAPDGRRFSHPKNL